MNHISRVLIKGYKSLHNTETTFCEGLNVIIGANGSGKTNFVKALRDSVNKDLREDESSLRADFFYEKHLYQIDVEQDRRYNEILGKSEIVSPIYFNDGTSEEFISEYHIPDSMVNFHNYLYIIVFIDYGVPFGVLDNIKISQSNYFDIEGNYDSLKRIIVNNLKPNGETTDDEFVKTILVFPDSFIKTLKDYTPIENIRFNQDKVIEYQEGRKVYFDNIQVQFYLNGRWLYWQQLSDGTRRLFYLITEIYLARGVIFIEEPELGIHPHQLQKLMEFVKEQAKEKQIILTTHSPEVLNHCITSEDLDRIIIAKMTADGTKLYHLDEKQKAKTLKYLKNELSIADYWLHSDLEK
jgi:AAA15 family ATPase/GTPase